MYMVDNFLLLSTSPITVKVPKSNDSLSLGTLTKIFSVSARLMKTKFVRSLYRSAIGSGYGLISCPHPVFEEWYYKGNVRRLKIEYDSEADVLTVKPIRTPLEKVAKPKKKSWFGLM